MGPLILALTLGVMSMAAQENPDLGGAPVRANILATNTAGGYASDIVVVSAAQQEALEQARQMRS